MSQLIQMRKRIKAVETIQKITHAMQLISMSTHLRLRDKKAKLELYHHTIKETFDTVKEQVPTWLNPLFIPTDPTTNPLIILIGSQKGLCGTFNTALFYAFEKDVHQQRFGAGSIISVGKKTTEYITAHKTTTCASLNHVASYNELNWTTVAQIVDAITASIMTAPTPYYPVLIYGNYPVGFFVQRQQTITLIPLETTAALETPAEEFIWEDNPHIILDALAQQYLRATLYYGLVQSLLAEQAARFVSMDHATRNAKNLKETMKLQYNKLRQAKITKELTELSSSFQSDFSSK